MLRERERETLLSKGKGVIKRAKGVIIKSTGIISKINVTGKLKMLFAKV